jgi:thermitase
MKYFRKNILRILTVLAVGFLIFGLNLLYPLKKAESSFDETSDYQNVIIKFRPLVPRFIKNNLVRKYSGSLDKPLVLGNTFSANVPRGERQAMINNLNRNLWVDYVEEDYEVKAFVVPNDPLYDDQWGLEKISADQAWDLNKGSGEVNIAILDTGINKNNDDLKDKVTTSVNCTDSSCAPYESSDPYGHGTHVAGIVAASTDNGVGVAGVTWEGGLMSVKVLGDSGEGYYSWVADGIVWAADHGADVINLSLGGRYTSFTLKRAVDYAWDRGVVIVAAAGNDGSSRPVYPAYYKDVVSVAAVDENDNKADFSNYGYWVDVAAPGVSILSAYKDSYEYFSGTSMATPFVTGVAALVLSQNPQDGNLQVIDQIESTADAVGGTGNYWEFGRVNACKAIGCDFAIEPTETPTSSPSPSPTPTSTSTPTPTLIPTPTLTPTSTPSPSPTPTSSPSPTSTPSPIPTSTETPIPTPTSTPTVSPTPNPTPTPAGLPWWCKYIPWHYTCQ